MLRTVLTPVTTNVNLSIPKEYLGKKIEILLFSTDEASPGNKLKKDEIKVDEVRANDAWLKLSEETLSSIWETKENKIWDKYYRKQNKKGSV